MISDKAIIDSTAKIGKNVTIGPFSIIGENVTIDDNTQICSHAIIKGPTFIGKNCKIYQFASIGEDCQDKKYGGEKTELIIGDNNFFREGCTVHRGTVQGGGKTIIGNNNLFMVNSHVAHDCKIGNEVILSHGASIAGHVVVDDYSILGGLVGVHQFCHIGAYSFAAGGTIIYKDVLPFSKVSGVPAKSYGLNLVGLERRGFDTQSLQLLKSAYRIVFHTSNTVNEALLELQKIAQGSEYITLIINFLMKAERGIVR